jgi:hypothetical protein
MDFLNTGLEEGTFQSTRNVWEPASVIQLSSEPPAELFVDPPLTEPLAFGRVVIQYTTKNLRIVPVYGEAAMEVSPRIGHLHITVDDSSWHWLDASGEPLTLNGFARGQHRILIELADPMHKIIDHKTVTFIIPELNNVGV